MKEIILKLEKLFNNYINKYGRQPNAVLINQNDMFVIEQSREILDCAKVALFCGLKIIPIRHGEMEVVELL